jgi:glycosidase
MPDLNYETQAVKDTMFATAAYWLDTIGVDGFRLDAVLYIIEEGDLLQNTASTFQFWHDYNTYVKAVKPDAFSVGEAWTGSNTILEYVTEDRLDLCFEFNLAYSTLGAVNAGDASGVRSYADYVYGLYPYLQYATFLTNHDQDRTFTVLGDDEGKAKAAAGIYLTLPGVPFVYYGEEIGMTGSGDHLNIRTPMQWTDGPNAGFTTGTPWHDVNGDYEEYNIAVEEPDPGSLLNWYKRLIQVRNQSLALREGAYDPLASSEPAVLAFVRTHEQQKVLTMVNTAPYALGGITLSGSAVSLEPGEHTLVSLVAPGDTLEITVTPAYEIAGLNLSGHEVAVYQFADSTGVGPDGGATGSGLQLEPVYPNPFTPPTTIRYSLSAPSHVRLSVYDVAGREVAVLEDGPRSEGPHEARWDGADRQGQRASAGTYFVRLDAGGETRTSKITLVR